RLLGVDPDRLVLVPDGYDPELFVPRAVDRAAVWRRLLVEQPRGWGPRREPGSVRYDRAPDAGATVLLYVRRYTEGKRLPLLIEAFAGPRGRFAPPAALVLVGGFPGEWEGEHPLDAIRRLGVPDVYLAGWHEHHELPEILAAADAVVLASVREQFG